MSDWREKAQSLGKKFGDVSKVVGDVHRTLNNANTTGGDFAKVLPASGRIVQNLQGVAKKGAEKAQEVEKLARDVSNAVNTLDKTVGDALKVFSAGNEKSKENKEGKES